MAAYQELPPGDSKHKRNKSIKTFESWMIRKAPGLEGRDRSWANFEKERIHRSSDDLAEEVSKRGKSGTDALLALTTTQQRHVSSLVEGKQRKEKQSDAEWSWVLIHLDFVGKVSRGVKRAPKDARAICVTLQRSVKIADSGPSIMKNLDEQFRKADLHEEDEHIVQAPDLREDHRGFAFPRQSPDGDHQHPGIFQGQLHMPQPNASGSATAPQMGEPPVSQRWTSYPQHSQASDYPGSQQGYPPPPLGPNAYPQMNYPGPQRTVDVSNPLTPVDIPRPFEDSKYLQHPYLRGDGAFHSRNGSQYAGSGRDSGVFQHSGLPDPQVEPPDIEGWRKESTGPTHLPGRHGKNREDRDESSHARSGNKYYKHRSSYQPASQRSSRYYKHKESVVQPAMTRRRSPRDDDRCREPRPRHQDRRPSPRVSQRGRQESYSPSPVPKRRHHRDQPHSSSASDGRRGRDRTSRKNRSHTPDDDDYSSERSSRSSSASPSPAPRTRRPRGHSAERRDDYSPTRTSRKERREYRRREVSPRYYRR